MEEPKPEPAYGLEEMKKALEQLPKPRKQRNIKLMIAVMAIGFIIMGYLNGVLFMDIGIYNNVNAQRILAYNSGNYTCLPLGTGNIISSGNYGLSLNPSSWATLNSVISSEYQCRLGFGSITPISNYNSTPVHFVNLIHNNST